MQRISETPVLRKNFIEIFIAEKMLPPKWRFSGALIARSSNIVVQRILLARVDQENRTGRLELRATTLSQDRNDGRWHWRCLHLPCSGEVINVRGFFIRVLFMLRSFPADTRDVNRPEPILS